MVVRDDVHTAAVLHEQPVVPIFFLTNTRIDFGICGDRLGRPLAHYRLLTMTAKAARADPGLLEICTFRSSPRVQDPIGVLRRLYRSRDADTSLCGPVRSTKNRNYPSCQAGFHPTGSCLDTQHPTPRPLGSAVDLKHPTQQAKSYVFSTRTSASPRGPASWTLP